MRILAILIFMIFISAPAVGYEGIFSILDEKYIDTIGDLPYSEGTPDMQIQKSGNIRAWIDIVGFKMVACENGVCYVPGDPVNFTFVKYDAQGTHSGITESITKTVTLNQSGDNITASLNVVLKWYTLSCSKWGCWPIRRTETATFQDIEPAPKKYIAVGENATVRLIQYNNSLYENIGIQITNPERIAKTTIQYQDKIAVHSKYTWHVEITPKGVTFANRTDSNYWSIEGNNISRIGDTVFINGNLSQIDLSGLRISSSNIYEKIDADPTKYNLSRVEFKPENDVQNPVLLSFLCVVGVMISGVRYYITRMAKKWQIEI